jgi:hypothetical protein
MTCSTRSATATKRYRVVQWATGNVGSRSLRRAIEHPDLDVVGVWVNSAAKVGRDAGELAGFHRAGTSCCRETAHSTSRCPFPSRPKTMPI